MGKRSASARSPKFSTLRHSFQKKKFASPQILTYLFYVLLLHLNFFRVAEGGVIVKRDHPQLGIATDDATGESWLTLDAPPADSVLPPAVIPRGEKDLEIIDEHHHKRKLGQIPEHKGPLHVHPFNLPANVSEQDIFAARRDAVRYRIRNTSELHIDSFEDTHDDKIKPLKQGSHNAPNLNNSMLHRIIIFAKPFHFHLPIISKKMKSNDGLKVSYRTERMEMENDALPSPIDIVRREDEEATTSLEEEDEDISANLEQSEEIPSILDTRDVAVANELLPRNTHLFHEGKKLENMEALLDQHPKLIPSVNRKRDSGKTEQDMTEEEFWLELGAQEEADQESPEVIATKRNLKNVNFSQNFVDSILNHEDDYVKYHKKINSQAQKFGMKPHDVFHAVVQGKPLVGQEVTSGKAKNLQEIQRDFQTFLGEKEQGEGDHDERNAPYKPFNSYMKILKREKRGLKRWLRKWLGPEPTEKPTNSSNVIVAGDPDIEVRVIMKKPKPTKKEGKANQSEENGDKKTKSAKEDKEDGDKQENVTSKAEEASEKKSAEVEEPEIQVEIRRLGKKDKEGKSNSKEKGKGENSKKSTDAGSSEEKSSDKKSTKSSETTTEKA
ncbi:unnamed protein product [Orchesella dallaii]|uniref:Uncharacterized protein n=1 Tax=Orchesella dallaii TaxID=48710 RepID=A0ABP1Q2U9_9HEXA